MISLKMRGLSVLLVTWLVAVASSEDRDARWFNRDTKTVTKVVKEQVVITEATPSSCVVVQTSLPPCRHLRQLPVSPSVPTRIQPTAAPSPGRAPGEETWKPVMRPSDPLQPPMPTPPLKVPPASKPATEWSWDIFNFRPRDVTITKTIQEVFTTKYMDPNTVVTFSVKGCRPSRLPFDLPECKMAERAHEPAVPEANVIVMAPVQFVPAMEHISPVKALPAPEPPAMVEAEPEKLL